MEEAGLSLTVFNLENELFIEFTWYLFNDPAIKHPFPLVLAFLVLVMPTLKQGLISDCRREFNPVEALGISRLSSFI